MSSTDVLPQPFYPVIISQLICGRALFKDLITSISSILEGSTFNFPYKKGVNEITNSPVRWDRGTSSGDGGGQTKKEKKKKRGREKKKNNLKA